MVLLKCRWEMAMGQNKTNLHSTMVLLKLEVAKQIEEKIKKSTFHYGSIKIYDR